MPVKWTAEADQLLLVKLLETHQISVNHQKIADAWPTEKGEKPTARAISERIAKIKKTSGPSTTSTPRARATFPKPRTPASATSTSSKKRKMKVKDESDGEPETLDLTDTGADLGPAYPSPTNGLNMNHFAAMERGFPAFDGLDNINVATPNGTAVDGGILPSTPVYSYNGRTPTPSSQNSFNSIRHSFNGSDSAPTTPTPVARRTVTPRAATRRSAEALSKEKEMERQALKEVGVDSAKESDEDSTASVYEESEEEMV